MTSDKFRFMIGAVVLGALSVLATAVALGKVEEKTSFGLTAILAILGKVALDFSEWAFRRKSPPDDKKEDQE
jgi:hypothetical protein